MREQFSEARKKLMGEVEEKLERELEDKAEVEREVVELRALVTRQNKALKQQNGKYEELSDSHGKLV